MVEPTYQIVLEGRTLGTKDQSEVAGNLAALFKRAPDQILPLLEGSPTVIRRNLNEQDAMRYRAAIERAGAACRAEVEILDVDLPDEAAPQKVSPTENTIAVASRATAEVDTGYRKNVSEYWREIFRIFERAGGTSWERLKILPTKDRRRVTMHWPALLFGVFWYFAKGLWLRGLTLLIAVTVVYVAFDAGLAMMGFTLPKAAYYGGVAVYGYFAKGDYYRDIVKRESWLKGFWISALIGVIVVALIAAMTVSEVFPFRDTLRAIGDDLRDIGTTTREAMTGSTKQAPANASRSGTPGAGASVELKTRYGVLSVRDDTDLMLDGKPTQFQGGNPLSFDQKFEIGSSDVVLLEETGGTGCRFLYYFATINSTGASVSESFGNCSHAVHVSLNGKVVTVEIPGSVGLDEPKAEGGKAVQRRILYAYEDGRVTERTQSATP